MRHQKGLLTMTAASSPRTLAGIQFGRAVAAILVVLYHGGRMLPQYLGNIGLAKYFESGNAGVDFFFVLSGFIIFYVHGKDIGQPPRLRNYLMRRFTRIYPIYWVVTAFVIALLVAKGDWGPLSPSHIVRSLVLFPDDSDPIVGVAWTLCHEMTFYLVFAALIASRKIGGVLILAWVALVVLGIFHPHQQSNIKFLESSYHIEFALGALTAYCARKYPVAAAPRLVLIGLIAFGVVAAQFNDLSIKVPVAGRMMYGSASAVIIFGLAVWENSGKISFPRWASFLGAASYSIYLIHTYMLGWIGKGLAIFFPQNSAPNLLYLVSVIGATAAGCILYQTVERRLMTIATGLRGRQPAPATP
jgi:peptidoglycan/LPS O-acetylase OafA/YrhL